MTNLITKYNGLRGLEYAQETINETTTCEWHLNGKVFHEGQTINGHQMLCIQTWVVKKVVRIGNVDHIYLSENL